MSFDVRVSASSESARSRYLPLVTVLLERRSQYLSGQKPPISSVFGLIIHE